ncbi:MAG: HAD hydrolase family protein [Parcubacteria group bacterium]|jgi:predicted HAD superfamily phosphohydrolase
MNKQRKPTKRKIAIITDLEGPWVTNDNAYELFVWFAILCGLGEEVGQKAYQRISVIDDIWGDFGKVKKYDETYSSGHTLKVILPFLKAMGAVERDLYDFSRKSMRTLKSTDKVFRKLSGAYPTWIVSTSYSFFVRAFCDLVGFDSERAHCTKVSRFDKIGIKEKESKELQDFIVRLAEMPVLEYDHANGEVIDEHVRYYEEMTRFIWETISKMKVGQFMKEVVPVGQLQKYVALEEICRKNDISLTDVVCIGDSQTDVTMGGRAAGRGLFIVVNGKGWVCDLSDIMIIGNDTRAIKKVVDMFAKTSREEVIRHFFHWDHCYGCRIAATPKNNPDLLKQLKKESERVRKLVRGVSIGGLT